MVSYNEYYQTRDYFGQPYIGLQEFFRTYEPKGHVLDLGCGQGRDALFLGRIGYRVTGVDSSEVGIRQMKGVADEEGLPVTGEVENMYVYPISEKYDFVLLDSMLHFYARDIRSETELLLRIAQEMRVGCVLSIFMLKGKTRERILKRVLDQVPRKVLIDTYTDYPEARAKYHMYVVQKLPK